MTSEQSQFYNMGNWVWDNVQAHEDTHAKIFVRQYEIVFLGQLLLYNKCVCEPCYDAWVDYVSQLEKNAAFRATLVHLAWDASSGDSLSQTWLDYFNPQLEDQTEDLLAAAQKPNREMPRSREMGATRNTMERHIKSWTLRVWMVVALLGVVCACSKKTKPDGDEEAVPEHRSLPAPLLGETESVARTNFQDPTLTLLLPSKKLVLSETPVTIVDQFAVTDAMAKNAACRQALEETKGLLDDGSITEDDVREIYEIVKKIKGFTPSSWGGSVLKFGRFTEVIIYGGINGRRFNVYLVRFPKRGWMFLAGKNFAGMDWESFTNVTPPSIGTNTLKGNLNSATSTQPTNELPDRQQPLHED